MIRIVDYGIGNIQAFLNLFDRLGIPAKRASNSEDLKDSSHLILPGVGHFDHAMKCFDESGLRPQLEELVLQKKLPIMGICVGMHMLAFSSEEGGTPGLGWIPGNVKSFINKKESNALPMPHMGWNQLSVKNTGKLFKLEDSEVPQLYFLHSYYFEALEDSDVLATTNYGFDFHSVIKHENIVGVQCHPEKSHRWGQELLKKFSES